MPSVSVTDGSNKIFIIFPKLMFDTNEVLEAIENVKNSPFLQGKTDKGDWKITFDWLVLPNNFTKVLEGQYEGEVKRKGFSNFAERDYNMSQMEMALLGMTGGGNHAD